jgi:hypothetical protein
MKNRKIAIPISDTVSDRLITIAKTHGMTEEEAAEMLLRYAVNNYDGAIRIPDWVKSEKGFEI